MAPFETIVRWLDRWIGESLYMTVLSKTLRPLYDAMPGRLWVNAVKRRLGVDKSPAWVPELYQLTVVLAGLFLLISLPTANLVVRLIGGGLALVWLIEIFVHSLHWLFLASDPIHSHRRSLLTLAINFMELGLLGAVFFAAGSCVSPVPSWLLLWQNLGAVFTLSPLGSLAARPHCQIVANGLVVEAGLLLLVVGAVVIAGINRDAMTGGNELQPNQRLHPTAAEQSIGEAMTERETGRRG